MEEGLLGIQQEKGQHPLHQQLSPVEQALIERAEIRLAGFDAEGNEVSPSKFRQDIRTVVDIERGLVVDPVDVERQLVEYQRLRDSKEPADAEKISSFARLGGHVSLNTVETLTSVARQGYVLLLEYVFDENTRVPGGYAYGFSPSFEKDSKYQALGLNSISAPQDVIDDLVRQKEDIITNWRTGVPVSFKAMADLGYNVPEELLGKSARRLSAGTALKYVVCDPEKRILLLNIGTIQAVEALLGSSQLVNWASTRYNGEFLDLADFSRQFRDELYKPGDAKPVAKVAWKIYWNPIDKAIENLERPDGVLLGKGGWSVDRLRKFRTAVWSVLHPDEKWRVSRLIRGSVS